MTQPQEEEERGWHELVLYWTHHLREVVVCVCTRSQLVLHSITKERQRLVVLKMEIHAFRQRLNAGALVARSNKLMQELTGMISPTNRNNNSMSMKLGVRWCASSRSGTT